MKLPNDDELSVMEIKFYEVMPLGNKLLIYSDHNTCIDKVLTMMNDGLQRMKCHVSN